MWRSLTSLSFIAIMSTCFAGCSLVQSEESHVKQELSPPTRLEFPKNIEAFFAESEASVPKLDPQQLNAGQHIRILTGGVPLTDFPEFIALPTEVVGTVKVVDSDRLVLQDVVMINEARSHSGVPILSKVPFTSRLFKNTSVGRSSTAVPGEVTLDLSKILHASELTEGEFAAMQKHGRPERIGVDFNVDVADGGDVTR
jgi:hypothetical protein